MGENIWELLLEVIHTKVQYVEELVDWNTQLKLLSTIAENQPQAAYLAFVSGFRSELFKI